MENNHYCQHCDATPELLSVLQQMADTIRMGNEPRHWDTAKTLAMLETALAKAR